MNETILVTGGAGFIGSHLCEKLLAKGYKVINLDNFNDYYDPIIKEKNISNIVNEKNYKLYRSDILDSRSVARVFNDNKIDRVIHLAAMAGVRNSIVNPNIYIDVDIKGTVNLLEIAKSYGIKRFIFASSSSVYGLNNKVPFSEDDIVDLQVSPYAAAKRCGEIYCKTYSKLYNMSIGCMRFFTVYGPRQRPDMAIHKFTKLILDNKAIQVYGDGESRRDYTYIDDIIDGLIKAMTASYIFEIFNLGNSNTITLKDIIRIIEKAIGENALIEEIGEQQGDVPITYANISKSSKVLGYRPVTNIEEGIEEYIKWYKDDMISNK